MSDVEEFDVCTSPTVDHVDQSLPTSETGAVLEITEKPVDFDAWTQCKRDAWSQLSSNPNAFFYRHVLPGEARRNGPWSAEEQAHFIEQLELHPPNSAHWGLFARHIPGRVGYQCSAFYKRLIATGVLNETPLPDGHVATKPPAPPPQARRPSPELRGKEKMAYPEQCPLFEAKPFYFFSTSTDKPAFQDVLRKFLQNPAHAQTFTEALNPIRYKLC
jgi:hypothetical protein